MKLYFKIYYSLLFIHIFLCYLLNEEESISSYFFNLGLFESREVENFIFIIFILSLFIILIFSFVNFEILSHTNNKFFYFFNFSISIIIIVYSFLFIAILHLFRSIEWDLFIDN